MELVVPCFKFSNHEGVVKVKKILRTFTEWWNTFIVANNHHQSRVIPHIQTKIDRRYTFKKSSFLNRNINIFCICNKIP